MQSKTPFATPHPVTRSFAGSALLALLALAATAAQAVPTIDVAAQVDYRTGGMVSNDGADLPPLALTATDPLHAAVDSETAHNELSRWWSLRASADSSGAMETSVGSVAEGVGTATATWHTRFVNDSGTTQRYDMDVLLSHGTFGFSLGTASRDFGAGFTADVSVNGRSVWSTGQYYAYAGPSAITLTKTGFDIGNAARTDYPDVAVYFELADYAGKVDLGTFAAGAAIDVVYAITSTSRWSDAHACRGECAGVVAQMDDPFSISGQGAGQRIGAVTPAVPEPGSTAMLLSGLLAVAGVASRRRPLR